MQIAALLSVEQESDLNSFGRAILRPGAWPRPCGDRFIEVTRCTARAKLSIAPNCRDGSHDAVRFARASQVRLHAYGYPAGTCRSPTPKQLIAYVLLPLDDFEDGKVYESVISLPPKTKSEIRKEEF